MKSRPPLAEMLDIIDSDDRVIGRATRAEAHGNPALLHRVVHVMVFDRRGRIFLQKRAADKDVQPGKWDTSVGGHVDSGETREDAVRRELAEELGIPRKGLRAPELKFLHTYTHGNDCESEMVSTWITLWEGPFHLQESEISDGRFWDTDEIDLQGTSEPEKNPFTPNFLDELRRWREVGSPLP